MISNVPSLENLTLATTLLPAAPPAQTRQEAPLPSHHMVTHFKTRTAQPQANTVTKYPLPKSDLPPEPSCFTKEFKDDKQRQAMHEEYNALIQNGTWTLVPSSITKNIVVCKWVFKL